MSGGKVSGRQLVARPPIVPSSFDRLQPERFDSFLLFYEDDDEQFRFKLTIVDRAVLPTSTVAYATCVFLIPAGRESEFMFATKTGLQSVLESSGSARLIAVAFGRHHVFESQQLVQEELTFVVQLLARQGTFLPTYVKLNNRQDIPFMALDGLGKRHVLVEGCTELSGKYIVEEVELEGRLMRRLYFLNNPFVIQSEVALKETSHGNGNFGVDTSYVAFDYHKSVVAGLLTMLGSPTSGLIVGLGGGGLVSFLHHLIPDCSLTVIELDPVIAAVAEQFFGLDNVSLKKVLNVKIGDGLAIAGENSGAAPCIPPYSLSFVVIDVDSKDTSVGMSCPPMAFLDASYLERVKQVLLPAGVLAINVSARDQNLLNFACTRVADIFSHVYTTKQDPNKDINVVIFASQNDTIPSAGAMQDLLKANDELCELSQDISLWRNSLPGHEGGKKKGSRHSKGKSRKGKNSKR